jgi:GT2 family glycosyltransferase
VPLRNTYRLVRRCKSFIRRRMKKSAFSEIAEKVPSAGSIGLNQAARTNSIDDLFENEEMIAGSGLFDVSWYRAQYTNVKDTNLIRHYLTHGAAEGFDPNPLFDTSWYLEQYRDVRDAAINPLVHYIQHGADEGRDPNPYFDTDWFLKRNEDVDRAGINPLLHYLHCGAAEGRDPSAGFDSRWYREQYMCEADDAVNPLDHYLRYGMAAGYEPQSPNADYLIEILKEEQMFVFALPEIQQHISAMVIRPQFFVLIRGNDVNARKETEKSLQCQIYSDWSLVDSPLSITGEVEDNHRYPWYYVELEAGDRVHSSALYAFAGVINSSPTVDLIYADEDQLDETGVRNQPFFKPDWSPDYLESMNYVGSAACFRGHLVQSLVQQGCRGYDLILRFTEASKKIEHVRQILFHRKCGAAMPYASHEVDEDIIALDGRLRRTNRLGEIRPVMENRRCYDCKISLPATPLVSLIIPTAGRTVDLNGRSIDLVSNCLNAIHERSDYKKLEVIVVDNGDLNSRQRSFLRDYGAKLISFRESAFNVAKKLNLGASIATGELFLLLNDDVEPLTPDWIERLVEHFEKPHVGIVGAKLLYADETTQHVGLVLNSCNPDHVRRFKPRNELGYFFSTAAVRNFIGVTGACMMTRASNYRNVGGYSEVLAVSYNDADFCLKTIERGLTVVYAPKAELIHFESLSRRPSLEIEEAKYFQKRWAHLVSDPFYNEMELTVASPTFEVRRNARIL